MHGSPSFWLNYTSNAWRTAITIKSHGSPILKTVIDPLAKFFYEGLELGQAQLAERLRIIVYKLAPNLIDLVNFYDDETFLEPLLFAYAVDPEPMVKLEQILFGYIIETSRPTSISVYADRHGVVELPRIGYLRTNNRNRDLQLIWNGGVEKCILTDGERIVEHVFEEPIVVDGTTIEVCRYNHPLLEKFFVDDAGAKVDIDVEHITRQHVDHLGSAFKIIRDQLPFYYEQILKATRRIVIYSGKRPFSFATLSAHGIAFLNASESDDEVFFIEDLMHQCSHVIFSAATLNARDILLVAADTPFKYLTGDERDNRDLYTALHGVFTMAWMNQCMDLCCESGFFSRVQKHELLGRFALMLSRFGGDLFCLTANGIFTEKGYLLLSWFASVYREVVAKRYDLLSQFDISNQPYCFSYQSFLLSNPPENSPSNPAISHSLAPPRGA